jgi:5-methylcytosine-specific restriction enzyme subunit McrC
MATSTPIIEIAPEATGAPLKRTVYSGEEQSPIPVPMEDLLRGTVLDIYPDVLNKNFFRIHLQGDRISFQAAGFLGFIPLNDKTAIEVRPRVPISNLDRILLFASGHWHEILERHKRGFGLTDTLVPSLLDLLAARLLEAVIGIRMEGLHYEYKNRTHRGSAPHGRIMPFESACWQAKTGNPLSVTYSAFERTHDTAANQCVRTSLWKLYGLYRGMKKRKGANSLAGHLGRAEAYFQAAQIDPSLRFLRHYSIIDTTRLPMTKPSYGAAIAVCKLILRNEGISIQTHAKDITLSSVLTNMERVFECYLRALLEQNLRGRGYTVLDGNLNEPSGAAQDLFEGQNASKEHRATPDIVIRRTSTPQITELIIDAKYRPPDRKRERDDIDQVLVYSLVYGCKRVALAYPRRHPAEPIVQTTGIVGGVEVLKILVDLSAADLKQEETNVANEVGAVLAGH